MDEARLRTIAPKLVPLEPGLWGAEGHAELSFPDEGHAECFQIEDDSFWFSHRNRCIVEVVRRHPPPGTIFDVGGGNGFVTRALVRAGFDAVLVEPAEAGARNGLARGLAPVIRTGIEEAGFVRGSLPAVGLFDVLEHIADDAGFLARLFELLAPRGRLYVTVPAFGWLWSPEDEYAGHHRRYGLRELEALLARTGFAVDYATYVFAPLALPMLLLQSLPARLGRRRAASASRDRHTPNAASRAAAERVLATELAMLRRGRRIPFGTSCLAVATRAT